MGEISTYDFYKLCIEDAGKVSERRMKNNQYFIVLHSALISFIATLYVKETTIKIVFAILFLSLLGAVLCYLWKKSILSYKELNSAKFNVICDIEKNLEYKCFTAEWNILKNSNKYKTLSSHETQTANIFLIAYIASIIIHSALFLFP